MGRVTLICGTPNAGKTTYSARFENAFHYDDMRKQGIRIKDVLKADDVVVEGLFETAEARRRLVRMASRPCTCIWLNTPLDVCLKRENRGRGLGMIRHHHSIFEPPTYEEGWDEIIIIK